MAPNISSLCKKTKRYSFFTQVQGVGVQPIREPPVEVHFDCASLRYRLNSVYVYYAASSPSEVVESAPYMRIFDFWWLHQRFSNYGRFGRVAANLLSLLALSSALGMKRHSGKWQ